MSTQTMENGRSRGPLLMVVAAIVAAVILAAGWAMARDNGSSGTPEHVGVNASVEDQIEVIAVRLDQEQARFERANDDVNAAFFERRVVAFQDRLAQLCAIPDLDQTTVVAEACG